MKQVFIVAGLMSMAALAWTPAPAADDPTALGIISNLDKDGDKLLSKAECAGTPLEADFDKLDTNKDGKLSAAELAAGAGNGGPAPGGGGAPPAGGGAPPAAGK